jgi:uncharacterized membrane protein HdeD (DUF308 family)
VTAPPGQQPSGDHPRLRAQPPAGAWEKAKAQNTSLRRNTLALGGGAAIVAGLVAALVPAAASVATALFIGWVLFAASVAIALDVIAVEGLGRKLLRALVAVMTFASGLYLLVSPLEGTFTLTVMLVLWFVGVGVAWMATGIAEVGAPGAGYTIAAGAGSLLLGVLIARELPSAADWAIGLLVGIDLIVYGVLCLGRALKI